MTIPFGCRVALLFVLLIGTGCAESGDPLAPIGVHDDGPPGATAQPPAFPTVSASSRIYARTNLPFSSLHGSEIASRFVLHEDGTFGLQYASAHYPFFEYPGTFTEHEGDIKFVFRDNPGRWVARGTTEDQGIAVRYNIDMQLSDFEDALYRRQ